MTSIPPEMPLLPGPLSWVYSHLMLHSPQVALSPLWFMWCSLPSHATSPVTLVFDLLHSLSHPSVHATQGLVCDRFVGHRMRHDIASWVWPCHLCQSNKIHHHLLESPYRGQCCMLNCHPKTYQLDISECSRWISINCLKPTFLTGWLLLCDLVRVLCSHLGSLPRGVEGEMWCPVFACACISSFLVSNWVECASPCLDLSISVIALYKLCLLI